MAESQANLGVNVAADGEGFAVLYNGKNARTPSGQPLILPTRGLADFVAREWRKSGRNCLALRLAYAAIAGGAEHRAAAHMEIADYAQHDLVCYPASSPASLAAMQEAAWAPLRDWAGAKFGLNLSPAEGIVHRDQPVESLAALEALLASLDVFRLAGLLEAARLFGSAVLALALMSGRLSAEQAHHAARIDEDFQAGQWGDDPEALGRAQTTLAEALLLQAWFEALEPQRATG